ncbi:MULTISPECIES: hypothetical protein [Pseudomonas]|jgi:hypothetical protein|uniref:Uncharacterized protein n=2 Tax=Pseudomonas TaxID=286 RepID=A0ABU8R468_9PSED|nr:MULTISPECIES: hypothetical protein [Pseudomonas]MBC3497295.1 hypothetical protein [Pseudomonas sp. SWRI67]MBV4527584.1 hypothetical protein [Pseudomonas kermanshahensis]NWL47205.1 hypothetical protein [Pseudomonas hunanensis]
MQDDENTCHDLGAEMELPDGVFPPMSGYTHEDLSAVAQIATQAFLETQGVDPGLIHETMISLVSHLYAKFEEQGVEFQIATWYQKPYDNLDRRKRSVTSMAEEFGVLALHASADALRGSPLMTRGREFWEPLIDQAGFAIRDHILKLNAD